MAKGARSGDAAATAHDGLQRNGRGGASGDATAVDGVRGNSAVRSRGASQGQVTRVVAQAQGGTTRMVAVPAQDAATYAGARGSATGAGATPPHGSGTHAGTASRADAADDGTDPLIGAVLVESYRVLRVLGEGGMGRVYEAQHTRIQGKRYALKVLHPEFAMHEDVRARFQREAEAAATINHTNVVGVYDVNVLPDGRPFLVSELLQGIELGDYIAQQGALPIPLAISIVRQMCAGLQAAHERGIVHRDVKPANVFLTGRPEQPHVKVLDFGISCLDGQEGRRLTQIGMVIGTPSYMAPEQARGERVDTRADVYATGAVLYRALTGERPFNESDTVALMAAVLTKTPEPPHTYLPDIPLVLEQVVQQAMARRAGDRFQHMAELSAALAPFDDGSASPVSSQPFSGDPAVVQAQSLSGSQTGLSRYGAVAVATRHPAGASADGSTRQLSAGADPHAADQDVLPAMRPSRPPDALLRTIFMIVAGVGLVGVLVAGALMYQRGEEEAGAKAERGTTSASSSTARASSKPASTGAPRASSAKAPAKPKPARRPPAKNIDANALVSKLGSQHAKRDLNGSLDTLTELGRGAPQKVMEPAVRKLAGDVAVRAFLAGGRYQQRITDLYLKDMGEDGLDLLFDLMVTRGGAKASREAKVILGRPDVRARCNPDLRLAYDLRVATTCTAKIALIPRAKKEGGHRTLRELKIMAMCGGTGCCLSKDTGLRDAMTAISQRQ